jgi:tRNA threonylcarbamoyladenosine biosynthesis protein TsaE
MNSQVFRTESEEETIRLGEKLGAELPPRATVLLIGDLGAGKTTLAKGLVRGLGAGNPEEVSSPTFTLIHEYSGTRKVYHIDLYRIEEARELDSLGLDEIFEREAVVLIEWGERFLERMPADHIQIWLEELDADARRIEVRVRRAQSDSSLPA